MNKKIVCIIFCLTFSCINWSIEYSIADVPKITPEHEITVNRKIEDAENPSWKTLWDQARYLVRNNHLLEAKESYKELIRLKPHIVAASWEYCKLLVNLEEWDSASLIVEGLLDYEPNNLQFLLTAGKIALANKHFKKSTQHYGQVLETEPVGIHSGEAILGLVQGLKGLNNKKSALVLLEQYFQRGNTETPVLVELAELSKELSHHKKARHYLSILTNRYPENKAYIYQLAEIADLVGDTDTAAILWLKYLKLDPNFLPFHKKIARYYLEQNQVSKALDHLKEIYKLEKLSPELSLQIADIYFEKQKRADKALLYYEQYLKSNSGNEKIAKRVNSIRSDLAEEYLPIVENGAVDNLWLDLEYITLEKTKIFQIIANLLKKEGKTALELSVIQTLFDHGNKDDLNLAYRLAGLQQKMGRINEAYELYLVLDRKGYFNKEYLRAKAESEIELGYELQGFNTYVKYLKNNPDNSEVIERVLELGGNLGLIDRINKIWEMVSNTSKTAKSNFKLKLKYIEAITKCGYYSLAGELSSTLLHESEGNKENIVEIYYQRVDSLIQRGLYFNAEQLLRQNLARDMDADRAIRKLVTVSLSQERFADARSWLELLAKRNGFESLEENPEGLSEEIHFLYIELLLAEGEYSDAEEVVTNHFRYLENSENTTDFQIQSDVFLMRIYFLQEEYDKCLAKIEALNKQRYDNDNELVVITSIIKNIKDKISDNLNSDYTGSQNIAFTSLLKRARWFVQYGRDSEALEQIDASLEKIPQSMVAMMRKIEVLSSLSRFGEAIDVVNTITSINPEEEYFHTVKLKLQFQSGQFDTIVKKIPIKTEDPAKTTNKGELQESHDTYFWKRLLLARALWAENRREESIEVYNSLLAVPVDSMFLEKMEVEKINFNMLPLKKSIWNYITFTTPEKPDPIAKVMAPQFMAQNIGDPIDNLAASLYGKYRWQELIKKELSARKAVEQKDYYHAEKEYISLLEEEKSQESLFDLANIYHKLGLYGKAAELYELMKEKGPLYPGLDEYIQANLLKRQPRVAVSILADSRKGRDGYINRKKRTYGLEAWGTPSYNQELSAQVYADEYRSKGGSERFRRKRALAAYSTYYENTTDLNIHFGVDSPSDEGTTEFLYKFELIQRINKYLEVYGRFEQDLVDDTLRSVSDSVIYRDLETGLKYDPFPRWFVGADYRHRMYSDDNTQNRYKIWSQYHLFGEVNQFKLKYSYELIRNDEGNLGRNNDFSNIFKDGDSVYWSPSKYWQQQLNFHFKHFFEKSEYSNSLLNFVTLDYSLGYDNNRQQSHEFDLNFFLEITRHFLLKGNLRTLNGDDLKETQAAFSLIYRW